MSTTAEDFPTRHPQVRIEYDGYAAEVDAGIAPLIYEMWKARIRTVMSCERNGERNRVWLHFHGTYDLEIFLGIVATFDGFDGIYARVNGWWTEGDEDDDAWAFSAGASDVADDYEEQPPPSTHVPLYVIGIGVRFPRSDYPEVLRRMVLHNGGTPAPRHRAEIPGQVALEMSQAAT